MKDLSDQDVSGVMKSSSYSTPDKEQNINMPRDKSHLITPQSSLARSLSVMSHANDSSPAY